MGARRLSFLLGLALGVLGWGTASGVHAASGGASALTLLSAERAVFVSAGSFCPGCGESGEDTSFSQADSESSMEFGGFQHSLSAVGSGASQDSWVLSNRLSGEGEIGIGFSAQSDGSSTFEASFQVDQASSWTLSGVLSGNAAVSFSLSESGGMVFERHHLGDPVDSAFLESIQLLPGGTYALLTSTGGSASGEPLGGSWAFQLVPEPGSASLLAMGLVGLSTRNRRA
jgi:hypothetical protein